MNQGVILLLSLLVPSLSLVKYQIVCEERTYVPGVQTLLNCWEPGCNDVYELQTQTHDFSDVNEALAYANGGKCQSPPRLFELSEIPLSQVGVERREEEEEVEEMVPVAKDILAWKVKE